MAESPDPARRSGEPGFVKRSTITIHDVAAHAGVSSMTVSRVMNDQKYVSAAMRDKVKAAIAELNYSPNLTARSLSASVRLGVLYSNPRSSNLGDFLMGAFRQAGTSGAQLLIEPGSGDVHELAGIERILATGIDGVILPPPLCDSDMVSELLAEAGVIALAFATAAPRAAMSAVSVDDFYGAQLMTRHLIEYGHRDIVFVRGDPQHSPSHRREEGFRAAMAEADLAVPAERVVDGMFTYRSGIEAARQLLDGPTRPTAVFASNDEMAAAVSAVAQGKGLRIPDDLSIGGFDDAPVASTVWPELTTIRQPMGDMAAMAVMLLSDQVRRARAGEVVEIIHQVIDVSLVARQSVAAPAGQ